MKFREKLARAHEIIDGREDWWDVWTDLSLSSADAREIIALADYEVVRTWWTETHRSSQRRAMRLLRSMLTAEQKRQLRQGWTKAFRVVGSEGSIFRLYPSIGQIWRVEQHGKRWISVASYCLHTPRRDIPPADETIAHMLQIVTNELEFMLMANETIRPPLGWQRAMRHGRCDWRPSWATKDDIERALAQMHEERYAQDIAEAMQAA